MSPSGLISTLGFLKGYSPPRWRSIGGPGVYTPCAALGMILAMSSTMVPRLTTGSRVTSTLAAGSGVSSRVSM